MMFDKKRVINFFLFVIALVFTLFFHYLILKQKIQIVSKSPDKNISKKIKIRLSKRIIEKKLEKKKEPDKIKELEKEKPRVEKEVNVPEPKKETNIPDKIKTTTKISETLERSKKKKAEASKKTKKETVKKTKKKEPEKKKKKIDKVVKKEKKKLKNKEKTAKKEVKKEVKKYIEKKDAIKSLSDALKSDLIGEEFKGALGEADSNEGIDHPYIEELRREIETNMEYPLDVLREKLLGRVVVGFTVLGDGTITNVRILRAAKYPSMNKAAYLSILRLFQFKPIPKDLGKRRLDLWVVVNFDRR